MPVRAPADGGMRVLRIGAVAGRRSRAVGVLVVGALAGTLLCLPTSIPASIAALGKAPAGVQADSEILLRSSVDAGRTFGPPVTSAATSATPNSGTSRW